MQPPFDFDLDVKPHLKTLTDLMVQIYTLGYNHGVRDAAERTGKEPKDGQVPTTPNA